MFVLPTFNFGVVSSPITPPFIITTRDTAANIELTQPTNPSGEVTLAFATDTFDFYVWDGSAWYIYYND